METTMNSKQIALLINAFSFALAAVVFPNSPERTNALEMALAALDEFDGKDWARVQIALRSFDAGLAKDFEAVKMPLPKVPKVDNDADRDGDSGAFDPLTN